LEAFLDTIKAANADIDQLNFSNMPVCNYINVCNTIFHAFLEFFSISKHFHRIKSHWCGILVPP